MQTSQSIMKDNNKNTIISLIVNQPGISRAEIALQSGLNKATVSKIVRELINDSYIIESGNGESSDVGGRKPILLYINKKAGISFSFDVRFDQITYMVNYLDGERISFDSIYSSINSSNVVTLIERIVKAYENVADSTAFGIIGLTIAIHGIVSANKIIYTPYYDLGNLNLASELEEKLNVPVYIENEANLAALAEATLDPHHKNLVTCSIHTGVGAGVIINRQLYRGNKGRSGEIGHIPLYPAGIACPCGNKGCFEQYCSQYALISFYRKATQNSNLSR